MLEIVTDKERDLTAENEVLRAKIARVQELANALMEIDCKSDYAHAIVRAAEMLK